MVRAFGAGDIRFRTYRPDHARMRKTLLVIVMTVAFARTTDGQRQLSVTPALGFTIPFCYSISAASNDDGYSVNTFKLYPSFDLSLQYNVDRRWLLMAGWHGGDNTAVSIKYGDPEKDLVKGKVNVGTFTSRFYLGAGRYLTTVKWFRSERRIGLLKNVKNDLPNDDILYFVLFRLRATGGISFDHKVKSSNENTDHAFGYGSYHYDVVNRDAISVFVGINLQFFNHEKDRIQFSITYNKGLERVIDAEFNYTLTNQDYTSRVGSRGSHLKVILACPIRLIKFK